MPPGWPAGDHSFDRKPTYEEEMFAEIVAEDRDRPIGPIRLDICLDLGLVPALMNTVTWDELRLAITLRGSNPAPLPGPDVTATAFEAYADRSGSSRAGGHSHRRSGVSRL